MSDEHNLLASLEAHGMQFLERFSDLGAKREEVQNDKSFHFAPDVSNSTSSFDGEPEEWTGFASADDFGMDLDEVPVGPLLDGAGYYHFTACDKVTHNLMHLPGPAVPAPNEVVFCEGTSISRKPKPKSQNRSFMVSLVHRLMRRLC